jgi:hypothetical protein
VDSIEPNVLVAHVFGTGKQRGIAYGTILKPYLSTVIADFFVWIEENVETMVKPYVPKDIAKLIAVYGVDAVLDLQYELMKHHMSADFIAEGFFFLFIFFYIFFLF